MTILTTRTLHRRQNDGNDAEVVLSIFEPVEREAYSWRCVFDFDPPIKPRNAAGLGTDWINVFTYSLEYSRLYFESQWGKTGHWQGKGHLGLPGHTEKMPQGYEAPLLPDLEPMEKSQPVIATRKLGVPGESGSTREIILTLYSPFSTADGSWRCAFSFEPIDAGSCRFGVGADFIESCLDALAAARRVYEAMIPSGWHRSEELLDCSDLPIKVDRAFLIARVTNP